MPPAGERQAILTPQASHGRHKMHHGTAGPRDFLTRAMEVGGMYVRSFNLTGESGIGFLADVD